MKKESFKGGTILGNILALTVIFSIISGITVTIFCKLYAGVIAMVICWIAAFLLWVFSLIRASIRRKKRTGQQVTS